jgi:hypothetical protein
VNATALTTRDTPGLTWRYLKSSAFDKWIDGLLVGLVVAWTGLPFALWCSVIGALTGAIAGAFGGASSGIAHTFHIGAGVGFGAAVIGTFIGAINGLLFIYEAFYNNPLTLVGDLISGLAVGSARSVAVSKSLSSRWLMKSSNA